MIEITTWLRRESGEEWRVPMEAPDNARFVLKTYRTDDASEYRGVEDAFEEAQIEYARPETRIVSAFRILTSPTGYQAFEGQETFISRARPRAPRRAESWQDRALREFIEITR